MKQSCLTLLGASVWVLAAQAQPVTFEDVPLGQPATDGSTEYNSTGTYYWNGSDQSGSFTSGNITLQNSYNATYGTWSGFAASNTTDNATAGYANQYSAVAGGGADGSDTYAVGYTSPTPSTLTFASAMDFSPGKGLMATNTTYTALDMRDGSGFSKKFGGENGTDPDWFKLTVTGKLSGSTTGAVDVYLADFRSSDPGQDTILQDWAFVDLRSLNSVDSLEFTLSSSDNGMYGMNTPAYFAVDSIGVIPEPRSLAAVLFGSLLIGVVIRRRTI